MEKLEKIQNLLVEWQEENPEKRAVHLVAIEVKNENKDGYSASISGANIGKKTILVDYYETVLTERNNGMYSVIKKKKKKVAMRGLVKRIDRMADDLLSKIGEFEKLMKDKSEDSDK